MVQTLRHMKYPIRCEVEPSEQFVEVARIWFVAAHLLRCNDRAEVDTELDR